VGLTVSTTKVEGDVDGGPPGGHCRWVQQCPPPRLNTTSMAAPLGVLSAGPAALTTEFEDDVDGGPMGGAAGGLAASTTEVGDGINGRPLGGRYRWVRQRPPLSFEDYVDGGPHGGRCRWVRQRPP
jgi:hypothetical protein